MKGMKGARKMLYIKLVARVLDPLVQIVLQSSCKKVSELSTSRTSELRGRFNSKFYGTKLEC
jgi:hypothetical protein